MQEKLSKMTIAAVITAVFTTIYDKRFCSKVMSTIRDEHWQIGSTDRRR